MRRIVLTGGGTAGHATPCLALVPALRERGFEIMYLGSKSGVEKELAQKANVPYTAVSTGKLRRYVSVKNITDPFRVIKGLGEAFSALRRFAPDVVFSKGGFVGVPVTYAAALLRIPIILHEGDYSLGLANRLSAPFASAVCVCFPETLKTAPQNKSVLTGMPLRDEVFSGDRDTGRQICGFTDEEQKKPTLLVMGGSQGAKSINAALEAALETLLQRFNVVHLTGRGNIDKTRQMAGYHQIEYAFGELPHILALADIVVSRAGANSACELLALKKPTLFIPLPMAQSRGDQILNAESFKRRGLAVVLPQDALTPARLVSEIEDLYENRALYIQNMKNTESQNPITAIMTLIERFAQP